MKRFEDDYALDELVLAGDLPEVGDQAPDFELVDHDLVDRTLAHWQGRRVAMVSAPSLDIEPVLSSLSKLSVALQQVDDVALLVVTMDTPFAQQRALLGADLANVESLSAVRSMGFGTNYGVGIENSELKNMLTLAVFAMDDNHTIGFSRRATHLNEPLAIDAIARVFGIDSD